MKTKEMELISKWSGFEFSHKYNEVGVPFYSIQDQVSSSQCC